MNEREKISVRAALIGVLANGLLSAAKILVGLIFKSNAVLADGVDTGTDVFTSFATLISSKVSSKPPDKTHPYGHERIEAVVAKIVSFIIFYAGLSLLISSSKRLILGEHSHVIGFLPLVVSAISVTVKTWLFLYKYSVGKKIKSSAFIADALNMRNDILISSTVFLGVLLSKFGLVWVDSVVALLVSIFIIRTAFAIFKETSYELMDGMINLDIYKDIFEAVKTVEGAANPHKVRVRQVGYKYYVDLDIEVDENITVKEGHEIATTVKRAIIEQNDRVADVMVHVEPKGNVEQEAFGLDEEVLKGGKERDNQR
ncbi:cation diffusion facilitator family transporter [Pseudothermotoga thermarum]|uniref:Cation diffusion facilitator family transporter n=1 Tax=Pseudothermotoga thermarum DSM 5069 TaxID=688269 RepID=F7YX32_9THEM|nr:cation diffusion facilitator family transporter [Pseudothermotoga thermarum]AEH50745.1 cation diffusion facilitator family transporter [Pseudothermotoga thermarum DSM 5069]